MATAKDVKEAWAEKVAEKLGGPMHKLQNSLDIQDELKSPFSMLKQQLAGYYAQRVLEQMRQQVVETQKSFLECLREIGGRVEEVVMVEDDDDDYSENDVEHVDLSITFPDEIIKLQQDIKNLDKKAQALAKELEVGKKQQQKDFYEGMAKLPEDVKNNIKPEYKIMNDVKQKEFSQMYTEKVEGVDKILKMAPSSVKTQEYRDVLEKAVDYKAEIAMIDKMMKREGDENLKPSQVQELSKLVTGPYIQKENENHQTAKALSDVEKEKLIKMQALAEQTRAFAGGYEIPAAPPRPEPKMSSAPRLERK